ncbi:MAG: substrate-binding domain-containing protein, partial [Acetobacteraceae bacterium]|nr:substrate-binding domain-containing protein [Acetobacteraceae bacterium]
MRKRLILAALALLWAAAQSAQAQNFNDPQAFAEQDKLLHTPAQGPAGQPWLQWVGGGLESTAQFKKPGPYRVCFSNAGVGNPWRVVGMTDIKAQADVLKQDIASFTIADGQSKDDKQISDIADFVNSGKCDILIVSPNTTAALTPAIEQACKKLPVVVFDRGVNTGCPVTFVGPIGGYAWGIQSAGFMADHLKKGASVLALRILPGVDVLETRYSAAKRIFDQRGVKIIGAEFTEGDNAKTKAIVEDYLNRFGSIDGVWMDAGATSVAA